MEKSFTIIWLIVIVIISYLFGYYRNYKHSEENKNLFGKGGR